MVAAIREQTAKVQDRDETIKDWERRLGNRTNTAWKALGAAHAEVKRRADQVEERDKEIERLSWSNGEQVKEIERLRAEMETVAEMLEQFHTLTYGFAIEMADIQAARLRAALKGAE